MTAGSIPAEGIMKKLLKRILPEKVVSWYHFILAWTGVFRYAFPGKKMIVIGVTGTKGKTSTANFIWACLTAAGFKTGIITTANIRVGENETMNRYHMTMPGRFAIQRLMAQMVKAGCRYCVVETTSEGIKQHRHTGVYYDIAVFTNLSPEHLQSHGNSFENYRETKARLFKSLSGDRKVIGTQRIEKVIIANSDSEFSQYFLNFPADRKITFGLNEKTDFRAEEIKETDAGVQFQIRGNTFQLCIPGAFNVHNALPAIIIANLAGVDARTIASGLNNLKIIPGRLETIDEKQHFKVFVDYAHERKSITYVLEAANKLKGPQGRTIILLGAEGGGRDKSKRAAMGELAAKLADLAIVSNVDPYDDDPQEILEDIAVVAEKFGKVRNHNLFVIEDRAQGIRKALALAHQGDVVLITGKGSEQSMIIKGKKIPWDDRVVVKEELKRMMSLV